MISLITFQVGDSSHKIDLSEPIDISIPLKSGKENPSAWYIDSPKIKPVVMGDWVGSVNKGASTNFNDINFNPHAHGTHTECVGHITKEFYSINDCLKRFFFRAELVTITPKEVEGDLIITKNQLQQKLKTTPEAIVIRTAPNTEGKLTYEYSNSNPPYLAEDATIYLKELGVEHLLIDLPSVDKEKDGGKLLSHKAFWNTSGKIRTKATITELIYVPSQVEDGQYVLNIQIAPFHNDASPSKPILYKIK